MKKVISAILSFSLIFSLATPAFAVGPSQNLSSSDVIGVIVYEDTISANDDVASVVSTSTDTIHSVVSTTANPDGSVTYYGYTNGQLTQYHTTIPGSGVLNSTYINEDGTTYTEATVTTQTRDVVRIETIPSDQYLEMSGAVPAPTTSPRSFNRSDYTKTYSNINLPTSVRPLGYMHYRHSFTDTLYSINCEVKERYHPQEDYTFNSNVGGEISFWLGVMGSVFGMADGTGGILTAAARKIVNKWISIGLIVLGAGTTYFGVGSKTFTCNWYEQEIHGTPTAPSGSGTEIYLSGVYAFVDYDDGDGLQVETEGFTVADWGDPYMGRWMMYSVFGIDEAPSSWTGLD